MDGRPVDLLPTDHISSEPPPQLRIRREGMSLEVSVDLEGHTLLEQDAAMPAVRARYVDGVLHLLIPLGSRSGEPDELSDERASITHAHVQVPGGDVDYTAESVDPDLPHPQHEILV